MDYSELIKILHSLIEDIQQPTDHIFLGLNSYQEKIFTKKDYPIKDIHDMYLKHIRHNAAHTLTEPAYYRELFIVQN